MVGRFQPFTYGHMKCVDAAWDLDHNPTVILMIDTPESKVDKKHPFSSEMLMPIYQQVFSHDRKVTDIILVNNADIVAIGKTLKQQGYEIVSWTCGTDRIDTYTKMTGKYKEEAGLADDFHMIEIKRTGEDISATKARKALADDDLNTWKKITPLYNLRDKLEGNKIYNQFRNQILNVI